MEYQNLRGGRIVLADVKVRVQIQSLHFICLRKFRLFVTFTYYKNVILYIDYVDYFHANLTAVDFGRVSF